jgi:hypothetical protein
MEELSSMWGKFSLREEENVGVIVDAPEIEPLVKRGRTCIVGKLIADRIIPKEYYKAPSTRIWRPMGELLFNVIGENLFIAEFEYGEDKTRILEGRPWIFDGHLVSLANFDGLTPPKDLKFERESFWIRMYNLPLACMGKTTGEKIGASVGLVEEVDVCEDAAGWGEYLRVKVSIGLSRPLARGRMLHLQGRSTWVAFKFEKLPKFCYKCGVIEHGRTGCNEQGAGKKNGDEEGYPYGPWLRVAFPPRRGTGGDVRREGRPTSGMQGWELPDKSSQSGASQQWRARSSEKESDGGGESSLPNPSLRREQLSKETEDTLRAKLKAGILDRSKGRDNSDSNELIRKGTVSKEGKESDRVESTEELNSNLDGPSSGPKAQYLGQWDSGAGRMVYEPIGVTYSPNKLGEEILYQQGHPRVWSGSKEKTREAVAWNNVSPSLEVDDGLSKRKNQEEVSSGDFNGGSKRKARGSTVSWKKRARQGRLSPENPIEVGSPEGKRKVETEEGSSMKPKKGRKNANFITEESVEKAGAVAQPRPAQ